MGLFDNFLKNKGGEEEGENSFWNKLSDENQLEQIIQESHSIPVLIFKDSTRCVISSMAIKQFQNEYTATKEQLKSYYLDLLIYRSVSNAVAEKFEVFHQSPQVLLIKDGKCVYSETHNSISFTEVMKQI